MRWPILIVVLLAIGSCATQPVPSAFDPPGFLMGLLHGFVAPWAMIGSLFTDIRIYAFPNSGGWYDFGYILGIGGFGAGASSAA